MGQPNQDYRDLKLLTSWQDQLYGAVCFSVINSVEKVRRFDVHRDVHRELPPPGASTRCHMLLWDVRRCGMRHCRTYISRKGCQLCYLATQCTYGSSPGNVGVANAWCWCCVCLCVCCTPPNCMQILRFSLVDPWMHDKNDGFPLLYIRSHAARLPGRWVQGGGVRQP